MRPIFSGAFFYIAQGTKANILIGAKTLEVNRFKNYHVFR